MITELEKEFFKCFGIERKRNHEVTLEAISGGVRSANLSQEPFYVYPQITDHILLELICILSEWRQRCVSYYLIDAININTLKSDILRDCLCMSHWYDFNKCGKDIKHQVHTLFEECKQ